MAKKPRSVAETALRKYQQECGAHGLGIECALAQLAFFAVRLEEGSREDSWHKIMTNMAHVRREAKNVVHALELEYPPNYPEPTGVNHE